MPDSSHSARVDPSDLTLHAVGPGDADLVRLFINADRLAEIIRTGVLGPAGPDGTLDLNPDQFVDAAVNGPLRAYVTFTHDGTPTTFLYYGNVDAQTVTGGGINAPGTGGGRGFATAASILAIDTAFQDPSVQKVAMSVYRWNTASVRALHRIGFVPDPDDVDQATGVTDETATYVLHRAAWRGGV